MTGLSVLYASEAAKEADWACFGRSTSVSSKACHRTAGAVVDPVSPSRRTRSRHWWNEENTRMSDNRADDLIGLKGLSDSVRIATEGLRDGAGAFLSRLCLPGAEELGLSSFNG